MHSLKLCVEEHNETMDFAKIKLPTHVQVFYINFFLNFLNNSLHMHGFLKFGTNRKAIFSFLFPKTLSPLYTHDYIHL